MSVGLLLDNPDTAVVLRGPRKQVRMHMWLVICMGWAPVAWSQHTNLTGCCIVLGAQAGPYHTVFKGHELGRVGLFAG